MKSLAGSLIATLLGAAMLVVGIAGVAGAFGSDDDDGGTSSSTYRSPADEPGFPLATDAQCAPASRRDPRLRTIRDFQMRPVGGERGRVELTPMCQGTDVRISMSISGMKSEGEYFGIWLYTSRNRAKNIGTLLGGGGEANGSGLIDADANSEAYEQVVVTKSSFQDPKPKRPPKVLFAGEL